MKPGYNQRVPTTVPNNVAKAFDALSKALYAYYSELAQGAPSNLTRGAIKHTYEDFAGLATDHVRTLAGHDIAPARVNETLALAARARASDRSEQFGDDLMVFFYGRVLRMEEANQEVV
jgi:hypothetical protein